MRWSARNFFMLAAALAGRAYSSAHGTSSDGGAADGGEPFQQIRLCAL
jgi:hypothetical protein